MIYICRGAGWEYLRSSFNAMSRHGRSQVPLNAMSRRGRSEVPLNAISRRRGSEVPFTAMSRRGRSEVTIYCHMYVAAW